ncbi:MAG TPA: hypothetical protein VH413_08715 [Verrucomicrobiae bacterium]|nr:hypothetical protein [Verrucomicrobiae bacterium]
MLTAPKPGQSAGVTPPANSARKFIFERDTFAFANELVWEYMFDATTGKTTFSPRQPKPDYTHRCFVVTRAVRQFFNHARFEPNQREASAEIYRSLIREVLAREPRIFSSPDRQIIFPGYTGLRNFSHAHEHLLKAECGGAWRSYVLRSHWRMVFPITRNHQVETAARLVKSIRERTTAIVHLFRFPALTMNHGMILFNAIETATGPSFEAYDPNDPARPTWLSFNRAEKTFTLPATRYWPGGKLEALEIYRNWWF